MRKIIALSVLIFIGLGMSFTVIEAEDGVKYKKRKPAKIRIKLATIAPQGSMAMNYMEKIRTEIRTKTNNEVDFIVYWGGVQGDERNVLRKIRLRQLHGGAFSGSGLGQIVPEVRITEIPYMFRNSDEVAYVRNKLTDNLNKYFEKKGFIMLGYNEVGFLYNFSKEPLTSIEILKKQKHWMPTDDPLVVEVYKAFDITPIPLSVTDVMTSVSTNLINSASMTTFFAMGFRWYTRFPYVSDFPSMNLLGALLVTKSIWNKISPTSRKIVQEIAKYHNDKLSNAMRDVNNRSAQLLKDAGVKIVHVDPDGEFGKYLIKAGITARENLVGKLYSKELLNQALSLLDEYRRLHPESAWELIK
ncbi:MAG: TRAP transporter substrate-binding protein DctP [Spirochaetota bacterium]|nr:TRAP transporter substrate-binding protein DctP [Spirochaetota bacterium]